jgi:tRNA threonylcarbamoyladenosine biosynthesis protein TsaE
VKLLAASAEEMQAIGARLAAAIVTADECAPLVITLSGDLGAGKTTLVSGLLHALGHAGAARSPTYTLIEPYLLGGRDVNHCDLYRLRDPSELEELGLRDLLTPRSVLLVEWPERGGNRLATPDLAIALGYRDDGRSVDFAPASEPGRRLLSHIAHGLALDRA